jgi:Dna[CI] antecedent, DciA
MNRDFLHVRHGLEKVIGSGLRRISPEERPVLAWPLACGSKVAARTRALDFAGGVLRVEVPDAGWRAELQALAPRYVAVIHSYVPENVERIDFVLAGALSSEERRRF